MRPTLKDGRLTIALSVAEERAIEKALELCQVLGRLSPIDPSVTKFANDATSGMAGILNKCGSDKVGPPTPSPAATETLSEQAQEEEAPSDATIPPY